MSETVKISPITASYYRELPEGPPFYQLIDGFLEMTPAPNTYHQIVCFNLYTMIRNHADRNHLGLVLAAPIDVYLTEINVFQPDIVFVSTARHSLLHKDGIHGGPELVVEILSPSTAVFDLGHKKSIYARCGVLEYWVVDPDARTVTVFDFMKSADDVAATLDEPSTLSSPQFPGLEISLAGVFAGPELLD